MGKLARSGKTDIVVRGKALELVERLRPKDGAGQVHAIFEFVRDNIRYVNDVHGVETVHIPREVLAARQGDCDDKSILLSALLESIGHPTRFVAVGFKRGQFSHVFAQTWLGQRWVSLDATEPVKVGWEPPGIVSRYIQNV